jgi:hypothetical protein
MKNIKDMSRILVEQILSEKYVDANKTLAKLVLEAEEAREEEIATELGDEMSDQVSEDESTKTDEIDEPTDGDPNLGDDLDDDLGTGEDEDAQVGNGELSEMSNDIIEINCEINQKVIDKLYDKVSNLKSQINSLNLDKDEREYIRLETSLSYYGNKLDELQTKTNPAIDQSKVEERLEIISKALKTLESEILGANEDAMDDVKSTDELDQVEETNADANEGEEISTDEIPGGEEQAENEEESEESKESEEESDEEDVENV